MLLVALLLSPIGGTTRSADALSEPTTSAQSTAAPAGFLPAPNPQPYCESPTYFEHWPAQASGPWVTSADSSNPDALTLTHHEIANVGTNTGGNAHWGQRYGVNGQGYAVLSDVMFYSQWVFTDFDVINEGFELDYYLDAAGTVVPGGGVVGFGGDPAYSFTSNANNNITGVNTVGRNKQGYDLDGRFQVDYLGPVRRLDISRVGGGVSGFVAGGGCEPLGSSKRVLTAPVWDPANEVWNMSYEIKAVNNLPTQAQLEGYIQDAIDGAATSSAVPDPVPTVAVDAFQIADDLAATFVNDPAIEGVTVVSTSNPTGGLTLDPAYDGVTNTGILAGSDSLQPDQEETVIVNLAISPERHDGTWPGSSDFSNQAMVTGNAGGEPVSDLSDNGTNPRPGADNDNPDGGTGNNDPTPVTLTMPPSELANAKTITAGPVLNPDGSIDVTYEIVATNSGGQRFIDLQISDDPATTFGAGSTYETSTVTASGECAGSEATAWGPGAPDLLAGGATSGVALEVGEVCTVTIELSVTPANAPTCDGTSYPNTATAHAMDTNWADVMTPASATFDLTACPGIEVDKIIAAGPTLNTDGSIDVTYEFAIDNTGDTSMFDVTLTDDLEAVFGAAPTSAVVTAVPAGPGATCTANPSYDGATAGDIGLLIGTDDLPVATGCTVTLVVNVTPSAAPGADPGTTYANEASVSSDDPWGTPYDDDASAPFELAANPSIEVTKTVTGGPTLTSNGEVTTTYELVVDNTGDVTISDVSLTDDLESVFGAAPSSVVLVATPSGPGATCTANPAYDGATAGDTQLLLGTDDLEAGTSCTVTATVVVTPDPGPSADPGTVFTNSASASGSDPWGGTATGGDTSDITVTAESGLEVAKSVSAGPTVNADGSIDVTYEVELTSTGNVSILDITASDDLEAVYGAAPDTATVTATPTGAGATCTANPAYDGATAGDIELLVGTDDLPAGTSCTIEIAVNVTPASAPGADPGTTYTNTVSAGGTDPFGNSAGGDAFADVVASGIVSTETTKSVSAGPTLNSDGSFDLTYTLEIENTGDFTVGDIGMLDDLQAVFGAIPISTSVLTTGCTPNPAYDGATAGDTQLLIGTDDLLPGATCTIELAFRVQPIPAPATDPGTVYENTATSSGSDPWGDDPGGPSSDPTDPEGEGPTPVSLAANPELTTTKAVTDGPTINDDGSFDITYTLTIDNTGDVRVVDLSLVDDLESVFGAAPSSVGVTGVPSGLGASCVDNAAYDGATAGDIELLSGGSLEPGTQCTVTLAITVTPVPGPAGDPGTEYANTATSSGLDPWGSDPGGDTDPEIVTLAANPELTATKAVAAGPTVNADGTISLTYDIEVANTGDVDISDVGIVEDLVATFGPGTSVTSAVSTAGGDCAGDENPAWTGLGAGAPSELLGPGVTVTVANSCVVELVLVLRPGTPPGLEPATTTWTNEITASGTDPYGNEASDTGTADAEASYRRGLTADKATVSSAINGAGHLALTYEIAIENTGAVDMVDVTASDSLATTFGVTSVADFVSGPTLSSVDGCSGDLHNAYDGIDDEALLSASTTIGAGEICTITLEVVIDSSKLDPLPTDPGDSTYVNSVTIAGTDPFTGDELTNTDSSEVAITDDEFTLSMATTKTLEDGFPINNADGTIDWAWTLEIDNTGTLDIVDLSALDDMAATFGAGTLVSDISIEVSGGCAGDSNAAYDGLADVELLAGGVTLPAGAEPCEILLSVSVDPGDEPETDGTTYTNTASISGAGPNRPDLVITDEPESTGDVSFSAAMSLDKTTLVEPVVNADGTLSVTWLLTATNTGDVNLVNFSILDDLDAVFGDGSVYVAVDANPSAASTGCGPAELNPAYDGVGSTELMSAAVLEIGTTCELELSVQVTPANLPTAEGVSYTNTASGSGQDPFSGATAGDDGSDEITAVLDQELGATKAIIDGPTLEADGTFTLTYLIGLHNTGQVDIGDLQGSDDLAATFGPAVAVNSSVLSAEGVCAGTENPTYDGTGDVMLLSGGAASGVVLAPAEQCDIELTINVMPGDVTAGDNLPGPFQNTAVASGVGPYGDALADDSTEGTDPDTDGDGDPATDSTPTPFSFSPAPGLTVIKALGAETINNGDGSYTVNYLIEATNTGDVNVNDLNVTDDLELVFGAGSAIVIDELTAGTFATNPTYDGTSGGDIGLLSGTESLAVGDSVEISLTVTVTPTGPLPGPYLNTATGTATDPYGNPVSDTSGDGDGGDDDAEPTGVSLTEGPSLGVAKQVTDGPTLNIDGSFTMTFEIGLANTGDVDLRDVGATDDLAAAFGASSSITVDSLTSTGVLTVSADYDGVADTALLAGGETLVVGGVETLTLAVTVLPDAPGDFENTATGTGTSPGGAEVEDDSANGADPDPDGDSDPNSDNDPTPVDFATPGGSLGLGKTLRVGPADNGDGTYDSIFDFDLANLGEVVISDLSITDDLATQWPGVTIAVLSNEGESIDANPAFDGVADTELLAGGQSLAPGETANVTLVVRTTRPESGTFENSADVAGVDPYGTAVLGSSISGANLDPDGDGDPTNNIGPTSAAFPPLASTPSGPGVVPASTPDAGPGSTPGPNPSSGPIPLAPDILASTGSEAVRNLRWALALVLVGFGLHGLRRRDDS